MFHCNRTTRTFRTSVTTVLCAALFTTGAMAANVALQTIDLTPAAKTIAVGQKETFTATGTFSNGSRQVLGPAIANTALGRRHTCTLLTSGGVECWGLNESGQLGDGTTANSLIPRAVKGMTTARAMALGWDHTCALLASGAVKCWGTNGSGELGNGSNTDSTIPVSVTGISTATALDLGVGDSCALLAGGTVQCWGQGVDGQLGNGVYSDSGVPVTVTGISTATALALGFYHGCALLAGGTVKCWGYNAFGELGNGLSNSQSSVPVSVRGISTATALSLGELHTCALLASGAVMCWGSNYFGQLGNGSTAYYSSIPVRVTGISTAIAITAGRGHTCAVLRSGSVKCWGVNSRGQLGNGTWTNSNIPVLVRSINSPIRLEAGSDHTCALFSGGMMKCWGMNNYGQLGIRQADERAHPLAVNVVGTPGVVWTSSDSSKATITDRGVATGRSAGNTTISATTAGFINDNAVLTVK